MEITLQLDPATELLELFGPSNKHLRKLRKEFDVKIVARDDSVVITGTKRAAEGAKEVIERMQGRLKESKRLTDADMNELLMRVSVEVRPQRSEKISVYSKKDSIEPFTEGQRKYIKTMLSNDLTFCSGPAGTGKTYLAVAVAVSMLKKREVRKIVLARPAVEAGEKLGFLPGDLQAKVNPYLRPLFDSLEDMMDFSQMRKFIEMDIIEVIPLAFMRGRTLNEAVVICDEAQNTIPSQMLMFLTRLGRGSKMIITGDVTQVDLERGQTCGMVDAMNTLDGVEGIGSVKLSEVDIVRHDLVQNIVQAYEKRKKAK